MGKPTLYKTSEKEFKTIDFAELACLNRLVVFIIIFVVLINIISSAYVPRLNVIILAELMYYHFVIVENTQAQYFDNPVSFVGECFQQ